ncbi:MAG: urea transporter [Verrucomicrobiae bacterium]|nr:urea transporter [Verrucomicrobiae bacterium]
MISMPEPGIADSALTPWECLRRGIPRAYAVLFFSSDKTLGWALAALSLLSPITGLAGLAGAVLTVGLALAVGVDRRQIADGFILFNPMLVSMVLGLLHYNYNLAPLTLLLLWFLAVAGSLLITLALQELFGRFLGLSPQSLPAVVSICLLSLVVYSLPSGTGIWFANPVPIHWLEMPHLPVFAAALLKAFGAMLMVPHSLAGLLVLAVVFRTSPLTALAAVAAFCGGWSTLLLVGLPQTDFAVWCSYNFILTGVALGACYFVPSRMSLLLAVVTGGLCALVSLGLHRPMSVLWLDPGALPFNLVVLVTVLALRQRLHARGLLTPSVLGANPEEAAQKVLLHSNRFPHVSQPALFLPLEGESVITQGVDGKLTHRGAWNWALDFERFSQGRRYAGSGEKPTDYAVFDAPVLAPCRGTVVAVQDRIVDNLPGMNNPQESWGNHVIIQSDAGYFVMLAHLRQHSLAVCPGQRVEARQWIARCGNSGRSPIPHLHLQVQGSPSVGAPTRPFCLTHYVRLDPQEKRTLYVTSGIPNEGEVLRPTEPDLELYHHLLGWLPGSYPYRVSRDGGPVSTEILTLGFDESGCYHFLSSRGGSLRAFVSEGVLYCTDAQGDPDSLPALIAAGLARLPSLAGKPVPAWQDMVGVKNFRGVLGRRFQPVLDVLAGPRLLPMNYRLEPHGGFWTVEAVLSFQRLGQSQAPARAPSLIRTTLGLRVGVLRLEAQLCDGSKISAELESENMPRELITVPENPRPTSLLLQALSGP